MGFRGKGAGSYLCLAALCFVMFTPSHAKGEVKVRAETDPATKQEPAHLLVSVNGDAGDNEILFSIQDGYLKVNGEDPEGGPIAFSMVRHLSVRGGAGNDLIDLRALAPLAPYAAQLEGGGIDALAGDGDDRIIGPAVSPEEAASDAGRGLGIYVQFHGGRGSDLVVGSADQDAIYGGSGDDRLYGRDGRDDLYGGAGADRIFGGNNRSPYNSNKQEQINGGAGNDLLVGGRGDDELLGKEGFDKLHGGPGRDVMYQGTKSRRGLPECRQEPPGLCNPIIS
jgi:Ca2+-binding RTX toxin-like protein